MTNGYAIKQKESKSYDTAPRKDWKMLFHNYFLLSSTPIQLLI